MARCEPRHLQLDENPGARDRSRTGDLILTKDALYQLSYVGTKNRI